MTLVLTEHDAGVDVDVRVAPRSSRAALLGVHDGSLKIALTAPPVDGEANDALVRFVAKSLGIPRANVLLLRGERSRQKTLRLLGLTRAIVDAWVAATSS